MTSAAYRVGAGEPVLLLHGFTLSHHVWHGVAHDLASDYDVLAMTMPGHWGGPKLRLREVGIRGIADGIERDLDALGWGTCHVVGNSLGGQVGFELERRGRARSLAAINPGGGWKRFSITEFRIGWSFAAQFPSALAARVLGERAATRRRFQRPILDNASHQPDAVPPGDAANVVRAVSHCSIYLTYLLAGLRDGPLKGIDQVTVPTSLMLSEYDSFLTRAECMQRLLDELPPHVREIDLAGVGHIPMLENPEVVASALRAHLTRVVQEQSDESPTRVEVEER
ncbi:alpha/beta hydrolase [Rhodococcus pyridinivorans]|uniref:Alpha/beta hydrolase n=1 Tax=Rhodococcus pyridinivorans TaxID=103816 RepID=A0A7M2XST2_9NOCA|nr:alpha/beta hydrolase [Rhodococcus pyridinivorans]QOW00915.1 alpha/beta hydrolase [Rhodococcus pyridinivorans]WMM74931.1 alpha/beta hydrolase [Rhodococcus pyridinivorans]